MDTFVQIAQILFILSVLVILHEFGHYIPAKIFKVRAEKFYLFMDPGFSLFKKKIGETEWGIGWLPLGGYVKLAGMMDESMDKEQLKQEPQEWEFRSKPAWQRLIIMLGGITVNLILAWFIFTMLFMTYGQKQISTEKIQKEGLHFGAVGKNVGFKNGDKIVSVDGKIQSNFKWLPIDVLLSNTIEINRNGKLITLSLSDEQKAEILGKEGRNFMQNRAKNNIIDSVILNSNAEKAGLKKGDVITTINSYTFNYYDELTDSIEANKQNKIKLEVNRNGQIQQIEALVSKEGTIGIYAKPQSKEDFISLKKMSIFEAIPAAVEESYTLFKYNIKQFKLLLKPKTEAYKQIKSPIGITRMLPTVWDWEYVWSFMALFSIALAFMNLLPIPGLDGGHALFTIAEIITGKKLNDKTASIVQTIGMVILLSIMALTFGKDIYEAIYDNFLK